MHFSTATAALILALTSVKAVPVPQANKIGTGIYELGTGFDDSTGYDIENVGGDAENALEDSTALTAIGAPNSNNGANNAGAQQGQQVSSKRQIGNDAGGVDAIFQGVDAGAGQGLENGMYNVGQLIEHEGFVAGEAVPSKKDRRQLGNDAGGVDALFRALPPVLAKVSRTA